MLITVIGSSGSVSGPESAASCYLVQAEEAGKITSVVLDMGSGAYGQLSRYLDPGMVDALLLSHLHADHVVDTTRSEEHTSELQSRGQLVCHLLLEKKKIIIQN